MTRITRETIVSGRTPFSYFRGQGMRLVGGKRTEALWLYALAGALMVGGPVWHELYVSHYPARPEAFVLPLIAAALGAIVATGSWLAGGLLGSAAFGGLLFVFADLQLDPQRWTYTAVVLAGCVALAQLLASHRAAISTLALGAFFFSSLLRPAIAPPPKTLDTSGAARSTNPLLVHIVLDEQWGVGGLRAAGDTVTAAFLTDFYLARGFELYESAYSRYVATEKSLSSALSLGPPLVRPVRGTKPYLWGMRRIPYFERLHQLGYGVRVYQSTFVDFCSGVDVAVVSCEVESGNSIANIGYLEGSWLIRGASTARFFLNTRSHVYNRLTPDAAAWRRSVAGGGLGAIHHLTRAIAARGTGGTAWFAHLLLPHRPYQVDAECRVLRDAAQHAGYDYPAHPNDSLELHSYAGQVRCAHRVLAELIDAIDRTVGRDRSIVIVHGDHGSRIMHPHKPSDRLGAYSIREMNLDFPTLLAVRRPNVVAAIHPEPVPVQDVIWALARSGFVGPLPGTWQHYVAKRRDSTDVHDVVRPLASSDMLWARRPD